jgi:hypothetical protein
MGVNLFEYIYVLCAPSTQYLSRCYFVSGDSITYNLTLLEERFKVLAVTSEGRDAKTVDDVNVPKSLEAFVDPDLMRLTLGFLDHFQDEARVRVVHIYQWLFK